MLPFVLSLQVDSAEERIADGTNSLTKYARADCLDKWAAIRAAEIDSLSD